MNDSKYGRLYPERAVAPLRTALTNLVGFCKAAQLQARDIDAADTALHDFYANTLGFPPNEPMFLLRGQDVLASEYVRAYAQMVRDHPQASVRTLDAEHIDELAARMERWEPRKLPD